MSNYMNEMVFTNMIIELSREEPNDMEFGNKTRMLIRKYEEHKSTYGSNDVVGASDIINGL